MNVKVLLVIAIFISACASNSEQKPSKLISKHKMASILADIHRTEGVVNSLSMPNTDTASFIYRKLESEIYKKYDVDTAAYFQSYKYYLINPEDFTDMYKEVVQIIKDKNRADSLTELKKPKRALDTTKIDNSKMPKRNILPIKNAFLDSLRIKMNHGKK